MTDIDPIFVFGGILCILLILLGVIYTIASFFVLLDIRGELRK